MKRHGGVMNAQDLAEYSSEWVEPHFNYLSRLDRL